MDDYDGTVNGLTVQGEHMWEASSQALGKIKAILDCYFPDKDWSVEWHSVVDENSTDRGPFWSLNIFVETKKTEDE